MVYIKPDGIEVLFAFVLDYILFKWKRGEAFDLLREIEQSRSEVEARFCRQLMQWRNKAAEQYPKERITYDPDDQEKIAKVLVTFLEHKLKVWREAEQPKRTRGFSVVKDDNGDFHVE